MKRPGAKKDEMKLGLLKLKSIVQREQTDGGGMEASPSLAAMLEQDSASEKGSLGQGGN